MTKLQYLNVYLTERLMQAAEEILGVVGDTISEYQEEITRTKRENQYLKRHLITPAPQPIVSWVSEQQTPSEQQHCEQEWSPSLGQEDTEHTQLFKQEQGELRTRQECRADSRALADTKEDSIIIPPCVKSDCDQEPPQPHTSSPKLWRTERRDSLLTNTTDQIKTEPDGEGYGVSLSEPTSDSLSLSLSLAVNQTVLEHRVRTLTVLLCFERSRKETRGHTDTLMYSVWCRVL
nr:uncharacterized protein LOC111980040 [Salvelinus alpinus]